MHCYLCSTSETIVEPLDIIDADQLMPKFFEISLHNGHNLQTLQKKLVHVSESHHHSRQQQDDRDLEQIYQDKLQFMSFFF